MAGRSLFTSECVTPGHPDKVCDQVSDAVLDAVLAKDPMGRVACETLVTTNLCVLAGEITTRAKPDFEAVARRARASAATRSAASCRSSACRSSRASAAARW